MINKFKEYILNNSFGVLIEEASFKDLTTIGIGGKIKYLYLPNNINSLKESLKYITSSEIKYFVIGNGSNILVSDNYFQGVVISLRNIKNYSIKDDILDISAGCSYIDLVYLLKNNVGGFEELATIPGTIGGMIYTNAGCFKKSISDIIIDITYLDELGNVHMLKKEEANFSYRNSIFKNNKYLILSARFKINNNSDYNYYKYLMNQRRIKQPIDKKTAGSIFKNTLTIPIWKLIDSYNLRGYSINDIFISTKHTNFFVNKDNASFIDTINLLKKIKLLAEKDNYNLELEIEIVEF